MKGPPTGAGCHDEVKAFPGAGSAGVERFHHDGVVEGGIVT